MRTYVAKPSDRERNWYVVDANGLTPGRLSPQIAATLRGQRKPAYPPHTAPGAASAAARGRNPPTEKAAPDASAAWTGRATVRSQIPSSSRAWAPSASRAINCPATC